jgi:hypothetical protein
LAADLIGGRVVLVVAGQAAFAAVVCFVRGFLARF